MMRTFRYILFLLIFCVVGIKCQNETTKNTTTTTEDPAVQQLEDMIGNFRKFTSRAVKALLPMLLDQASEETLPVSQGCQRSLFKFLIAFSNLKPWAVYMVDSWAKSLDGILLGTVSSFGNYDECVGVVATESRKKNGPLKKLFDGQYCTIEIVPYLPPKPRFYSINKRIEAYKKFENDTEIIGELTNYIQLFYLLPFRLGICVPSTCTEQDVYYISKSISNRIAESNITMPRCEIRNEVTIEPFQIPSIAVFSCFFGLIFCGTMFDIFTRQWRRKIGKSRSVSSLCAKCMRSFSLYSNIKKLLDVSTAAEELKVLHGVKFYCMAWIILGHTYYHVNYNMLRNLKLTLAYFEDFAFNSITNATLVVDNFFFISGLLTCYVSHQLAQKAGSPFKSWQFVLHRIYRFWPMMMTFVGLTMFIPWFGDGPLWHENIDPLVESCRNDWWTNALFINNLYRSGINGCVSHGWFLAADMQMYLICLFVLIPLSRYPKVALSINFILLSTSIIFSGCYNYAMDYPPTMLFSKPDKVQTNELMRAIYYTPYHHLGPFCMGIFVGYFLHTDWAKKKIPPVLQIFGWMLALVLSASTIFGTHTWNNGADPGIFASSMYAAFSRVAWALSLAWIVWACITGHGGIMNTFLSWKALIPLSRLTFSVYLVHPYVQRVFYANLRGIIEARNYIAIFIWFGFLVVSYLIGFIICMLFEAPLLNLGGIIFETHTQWTNKRRETKLSKRNNRISEKIEVEKKQVKNGHYHANDLKENDVSIPNGYNNDGYISHL